MTDEDRFQFRLDVEEPESPAQDEALWKRVNKLGNRVSFLTLLLPCLLAVVVYVVYRDIETRVSQTQKSELQSAERLASGLEQKTNALLTRVDELEATLRSRMEDIQKELAPLQSAVKKNEAAVAAHVSDKADKKELADAVSRIDAALAALSKEIQALAPLREELGSAAAMKNDLNALSLRMQKLENSIGKDLTGLAGYLERSKSDITQMKTEVAGMQKEMVDREAMQLEVLKAKKLFQIALDQQIARIDKELSTVSRRLDQVEAAFTALPSRSRPPASGSGIREQPLE
jgi:chromosome segregation ATPase